MTEDADMSELKIAVAGLGHGTSFLPLVDAALTLSAWRLSALLWIVAFSLFLARYAPILMQPRVDGKPG